jgi:peptidoglycan/xylan/chitin deacetylase (PgdA/CDA1 family)
VVAANHALLAIAGMFPKSSLLGPNITRLPEAAVRRGEVALTFDDGPHPEITPRVLDLLARFGATASFFCIGSRADRYPALTREIRERGHSIENHTHTHPLGFALRPLSLIAREIDDAGSALRRAAGAAPRFFRAPAGIRSPLLDPALAIRGLRYVSWSRRSFDWVDSKQDRVLRRLLRGLRAGDILVLHDGSPARTDDGGAVILAVLPALLCALRDRGFRAVSLPDAFRE